MDELTEALVAAARAGSRDAWASHYVLLAPRVQGCLTARGSTEHEAMTPQVFVQVIPHVECDPRHDLSSTRSAEHDVLVHRLSGDLERALDRLTKAERTDHRGGRGG